VTGLEYLERVVDGRIPHPSMALTLGFRLTEVEDGRAVISGETSADYCTPNGSIHGSWAAAVLDSCMGSSVHSTLDDGVGFTVIEFKIDFVRPITVTTGKVTAEGRVVNVGKRIGIADGIARDAEGRILARGTSTCLLYNA
jgi:uncharacterized protein (TIGR00369 family)